MEITKEEIRDRINAEFRGRDKENGEDLTEYIKKLIKHLENKIGFTIFHQHIQLILKTFIGNGIDTKVQWAKICSTITGYEGTWLTAIGIYLSPEQKDEWET